MCRPPTGEKRRRKGTAKITSRPTTWQRKKGKGKRWRAAGGELFPPPATFLPRLPVAPSGAGGTIALPVRGRHGGGTGGHAPGGRLTMYCSVLRFALACVVVLAAVSLGALAADDKKDEEGFTSLFNGKDLTGWKTFVDPKKKDVKPEDIWTVKDGVLICTG